MSLLRTGDVRPLAGIGMTALIGMLLASPASSTPPGPPEAAAQSWDAALREAGNVDVNQADAAELERLPGVGPALAGRIVAERQRRGGFAGSGELLRVPGIGPATLGKIEDRLSFE